VNGLRRGGLAAGKREDGRNIGEVVVWCRAGCDNVAIIVILLIRIANLVGSCPTHAFLVRGKTVDGNAIRLCLVGIVSIPFAERDLAIPRPCRSPLSLHSVWLAVYREGEGVRSLYAEPSFRQLLCLI
jgi:hypothetical protein